jgi:hypothetical protein
MPNLQRWNAQSYAEKAHFVGDLAGAVVECSIPGKVSEFSMSAVVMAI